MTDDRRQPPQDPRERPIPEDAEEWTPGWLNPGRVELAPEELARLAHEARRRYLDDDDRFRGPTVEPPKPPPEPVSGWGILALVLGVGLALLAALALFVFSLRCAWEAGA